MAILSDIKITRIDDSVRRIENMLLKESSRSASCYLPEGWTISQQNDTQMIVEHPDYGATVLTKGIEGSTIVEILFYQMMSDVLGR